ALLQQVNRASTSTAISSSANPTWQAQPVTFTAVVTVNAPGMALVNPSGTVTFFDHMMSLGQGTLSTTGGVTSATFTTSALTGGDHAIIASYGGDSKFFNSTGMLTQTVYSISTSTAVASSVNPSRFGQSVIF